MDIDVVDLDAKPGKPNGVITLACWEDCDSVTMPDSIRVQTSGGGRHIYFATGSGLKTTSNISIGIDVKSEGGYVIAPGSRHASGEVYQIDLDEDLKACPAWLVERVSGKNRLNRINRVTIPIHSGVGVVFAGAQRFQIRPDADLTRDEWARINDLRARLPKFASTWAAAQPVSRRMKQHGLIEPASYASADIRGKAGSSILDLVLLTMMIFQGFKEIVAFTLAGAGMVVAQQRPSGARSIFESTSDVGKTKAGSTVYEPAGNLYRVTGGGSDMWGAADDFHFSWVRVSGDATLTADIQFPWSSKAPLEKAVLIFRQSLDPASAYADNAIHADGHITLQYRATAGGKTADVTAAEHGSTRLRIERSGNRFTAYTGSADGKLTAFSDITIAMEDPVYVGIGVCAHDAEGLTTVSFSNVSIERHSGSPGANKK